MQDAARRQGAELRERSPVVDVAVHGGGLSVTTTRGVTEADGLVVCADAWVNDLLRPLGCEVPAEVTLEQVTYFRAAGDVARTPLWIWMDDPSFYGFPCYGEQTVKVAQDCGGPRIDPDDRNDAVDPAMEALVAGHVRRMLPEVGTPVRSLRCQYTLTPDRDLVLAPLPGLPRVVVGLGAAHGFKFAPTFGRLLADLVTEGSTSTDLTAYRLDRPALTDPAYAPHWLV
jgi:sarcosine oxidase